MTLRWREMDSNPGSPLRVDTDAEWSKPGLTGESLLRSERLGGAEQS